MTVQKIFDSVNELHPHQYSFSTMLTWINEVEHTIADFLEPYLEEVNAEHEEASERLLADNSKIYSEYLIAMIDFNNEEYDRYNNHAAAYGTELADWKATYLRTHERIKERARIRTL